MSEQETMVSAQYVLEVRLADGDRLALDAGVDPETAQAELAAVHAALEAGAFVQLGDTAIVRAAEIRSARIHRLGGLDGDMSEALHSRLGGYEMSTYDTERRDVAAGHAPMRSGERQHEGGGPGFGSIENYIGYGRKPYAETKPFWMTSEFLVTVGAIAAFAIALGTNARVDGFKGWLLIAIVASAYIISRGIAKAGAKDPNPDRRYSGQGLGGGQGYGPGGY
jgi:hypothetical protein